MTNSASANDSQCSSYLEGFQKDMSKGQKLMSKAIAERQIAIQVAATRERLVWFAPMLAASIVFLYKGYQKTKANVVMYPLIPMTFALAYQMDFAYGTKMKRVKDLADNIMKNESHLLSVPELRNERVSTEIATKVNFGFPRTSSSIPNLVMANASTKENSQEGPSSIPRLFATNVHCMSDSTKS